MKLDSNAKRGKFRLTISRRKRFFVFQQKRLKQIDK